MKRSFQKLNELSVFFPCYNEEENLPKLMDSVLRIVPDVAEKYEIILINDGSKDKTSQIAHSYEAKYPFVRVIDQENQGYGGAVKMGLRAARFEWVFFSDSDLQLDLKDLYKFVKQAVTNNFDLVIGYRKNRAEGFRRAAMAKLLKVWGRVFFGFPLWIKDIDCAFKLIRRPVIENVGFLSSNGNLISTEFLFKAYKLGFRFNQIGVKHYKRVAGESTCGDFGDILQAVRETVILRSLLKKENRQFKKRGEEHNPALVS